MINPTPAPTPNTIWIGTWTDLSGDFPATESSGPVGAWPTFDQAMAYQRASAEADRAAWEENSETAWTAPTMHVYDRTGAEISPFDEDTRPCCVWFRDEIEQVLVVYTLTEFPTPYAIQEPS